MTRKTSKLSPKYSKVSRWRSTRRQQQVARRQLFLDNRNITDDESDTDDNDDTSFQHIHFIEPQPNIQPRVALNDVLHHRPDLQPNIINPVAAGAPAGGGGGGDDDDDDNNNNNNNNNK